MSETDKSHNSCIVWSWQDSKGDNCQDGCSQFSILNITRQTFSKQFNSSSKVKTASRDKYQLNSILISNCDEIFSAWNHASIAVSWSTTLQRCHYLGYDSMLLILKSLLTFKQKQKYLIWARDNQRWPVDRWNQAIFSDGSKFCISFTNYGYHTWKKSYNAKYMKKCKIPWICDGLN